MQFVLITQAPFEDFGKIMTKVTFGIITEGKSDELLRKTIASIQDCHIVDKEIIVVGSSDLDLKDIHHIQFDDNIKKGWITEKKNIIGRFASGDILIFMHDYISLGTGWDQELLKKFAEKSWQVGVCKIRNLDGSRYHDWLLWPHNGAFLDFIIGRNRQCLIPYSWDFCSDYMYLSGAFFICRKEFFSKNSLDNTLSWGEGEDVEWSIRIRDKWNLRLFDSCSVELLKFKDCKFKETQSFVAILLIVYFILKKKQLRLTKYLNRRNLVNK